MTEIETLNQTITALEAQRSVLGDALVEAMLAPVRAKLAMLQAQTQPTAGQRKHVTVLFADVFGFTALSETLDAEDVRDMLNAIWQQLDAAILAQGGKIDKHIGDGVMALWGAETAREDDPERAIKAALLMQAKLSVFAETQRNPLQMRIGLNTGPVLLGMVGSTNEYTAMGDTVNVASRLEQAAPIGGILIAHDIYRQVRGVFDVVPQPPLTVKGKAEPLQTYLVQRAKPRAFRMLTRGVEGVETRLVGRAAEMLQLQTAFMEVMEQHRLRTLTVTAEAGLGKSRLIQEFLHWAELAGKSFRLFSGRATPSTSETPYALLRDLLAFRFEIPESDTLPEARAKLETGMVALCPNDPQIQEKAHFIGHLAGWDFSASPDLRGLLTDAQQIRSIALHFLTLFFQNVAAQNPVTLILEDVHWADRGSLEALRHLLGNLPSETPLLVIANARPALFERDPAWQSAAQTQIDLGPLSDSDSAALVTDILRHVAELPNTLRDLIVHQADGNPFYVEELIKMLIDEKVILPGETEWRVLTERISTLRVPPTLTGVLQARLDSLPTAERLALQRAAVIGRTFWDTAVQALSGESASLAELQTLLETAQRRELLYRHPAAAFAGTREYLFKHALLRDVAYEAVLKRDRADYHAHAAQWFEAVSGARRGEYLPQIAEHYEKAGNLTQAAVCFEQAGEQATRVSAFADAVRFYTYAQDLISVDHQGEAQGTNSPSSQLALKLAEAHYRLSDYPQMRITLQQAQALAQTDNDRVSVLAFLGEMTSDLGDYFEAQRILTEAVPLARACGNQVTLCHALYVLGTNYWHMGKLDEARARIGESLALARALGDVMRELYALNRLGAVYLQIDVVEAEKYFQEVHTRAASVGNRERAMVALNNLGEVAKERQDYALQRDFQQQALALAREIGAQQSIALFLINLADSDTRLGQLAAAQAELREGLALALRLGTLPWQVTAVMHFANLAYAEGRIERALALRGLAHRQPAWTNQDQRVLDATATEWALDPEVVAMGLAKGAELDWDTTLQELLMG